MIPSATTSAIPSINELEKGYQQQSAPPDLNALERGYQGTQQPSQPSTPTQPVSYGLDDVIIHGMTLGVNEKASAALDALKSLTQQGTGLKKFGEQYQNELNTRLEARKAEMQRLGIYGTGMETAASMVPFAATGGALAPETYLGKLALNVGSGMASGGIAGAANAPVGQELQEGWKGAKIGGATAAFIPSPSGGLVARTAQRALTGGIVGATIGSTLADDKTLGAVGGGVLGAATGGVIPLAGAVAKRVAESIPAVGKLADAFAKAGVSTPVLGPRGKAEQVVKDYPGFAGKFAQIADRASQAADQSEAATLAQMGDREVLEHMTTQLAQKSPVVRQGLIEFAEGQQARATPLYGKAFEQSVQVTPQIKDALDDPNVQKALDGAVAELKRAKVPLPGAYEAQQAPEKVVAAAFQNKRTGQVISQGLHHGEAYNANPAANDAAEAAGEREMGFVTNRGRFVLRPEALDMSAQGRTLPSQLRSAPAASPAPDDRMVTLGKFVAGRIQAGGAPPRPGSEADRALTAYIAAQQNAGSIPVRVLDRAKQILDKTIWKSANDTDTLLRNRTTQHWLGTLLQEADRQVPEYGQARAIASTYKGVVQAANEAGKMATAKSVLGPTGRAAGDITNPTGFEVASGLMGRLYGPAHYAIRSILAEGPSMKRYGTPLTKMLLTGSGGQFLGEDLGGAGDLAAMIEKMSQPQGPPRVGGALTGALSGAIGSSLVPERDPEGR